jgi:hypothetical protein
VGRHVPELGPGASVSEATRRNQINLPPPPPGFFDTFAPAPAHPSVTPQTPFGRSPDAMPPAQSLETRPAPAQPPRPPAQSAGQQGTCGPGMRERWRGNFQYCEIWQEPPR